LIYYSQLLSQFLYIIEYFLDQREVLASVDKEVDIIVIVDILHDELFAFDDVDETLLNLLALSHSEAKILRLPHL